MSRRSPHVGAGRSNSANSTNDINNPSTSSLGVAGGSGLSSPSPASLLINDNLGQLSNHLANQFRDRLQDNKRPIGLKGIGATVDMKTENFLCPICFDLMTEAHITKCGHTFCYGCVHQSIEMYKRCPKCSYTITVADIFPNYLLDELITRHKNQAQLHDRLKSDQGADVPHSSGKDGGTDDVGDGLRQFLAAESLKLTLPDVKVILDVLTQRKQVLESETNMAQNRLLYDFLKELLMQKEKRREEIDKEITLIRSDLAEMETTLNDGIKQRNQLDVTVIDGADSPMADESALRQPNDESGHGSPTRIADDGFNTLRKDTSDQTYATRKRRINIHFDTLVDSYFSIRRREMMFGGEPEAKRATPSTSDSSSPDSKSSSTVSLNSTTKSPGNTLNVFRDSLIGFSKYNSLRPLATMQYSSELDNNSPIVSTIAFDKDNEYFAVGGVAQRIKIYDYLTVVRGSVDQHCANATMLSSRKISCLTWNAYYKNTMASSDYEGAVNLWDANNEKCTKSFHEHEKRCWSVDFNSVNARMIVSGSEDTRVKLWSMNDDRSVATLDAKTTVCCVKFNPKSSCHLAFGSVDRDIHYYDLRNMLNPLCIFKGHKKPVTYVKFLNTDEIVSASTDSQLRLWDINEEPHFSRSYSGHVNEQSFTGLSTNGEYIACGSEDNSLYVYHRGTSNPLFSYRLDSSNRSRDMNKNSFRSALQGNDSDRFNDTNVFISAVCFRRRSNVVLAANSEGYIKVLELV